MICKAAKPGRGSPGKHKLNQGMRGREVYSIIGVGVNEGA